MTLTTPTATNINVAGTGITIPHPTQGNAVNVTHYRSVEVWKVGSGSKYRVTLVMTSERVHSGLTTHGRVEVWCHAQGWREVLLIDKADDVLDTMPLPEILYRSWTGGVGVPDADETNGDIEGVSRILAIAAHTILTD